MIAAEDLFEHAPIGQLVTDPDGTIVRANRAVCEWTGRPRRELLGLRFADLLAAGGRIYHETHLAPLLHMQDEVREIALALRTADGERLDVLVSARLHRDGDQRPLAVHVLLADARARRAYERELLRRHRRERAQREWSEVVAGLLGRADDPLGA